MNKNLYFTCLMCLTAPLGFSQGLPVGNPPSSNTPVNLAGSAWYRGGNYNTGPAANNNILGTFFNSEIFIYTNSTKLAAFTKGNYLSSIIGGNIGNGLRIFNPMSNNTGGNLDLFTSASNGQNETHIVFGGNGQISGQASRLETYGDWDGLYFEALNTAIGKIKFARNGLVTASIGTNNYFRIGDQQNATNLNASRRLEVVDTDWQFRLTFGNEYSGFFTDFKTNNQGNFQILPQNGKVGINTSSNPEATLDVNGDLRVRNVTNATPNALIVGVSNGNANDLTFKKIEFTGNGNQVLLGNGSWGTLPTTSPTISANNGCTMNNNGVIQFGEAYNLLQTAPLQSNREIALSGNNIVFSGAGNLGIGLNFPNAPTQRLDVAGNIRLRGLPSNQNNAAVSVNKVVMVDNFGVLRWTHMDSIAVNLIAENGVFLNGDTLEWGTTPLQHDTELPLNGKNVFFSSSGTTSSSENVKIGGVATSVPHKLSVFNENENNAILGNSASATYGTGTRSGVLGLAQNADAPVGVIGRSSGGQSVTGVSGYAADGSLTTIGVYGYGESLLTSGNVFGGKFYAESQTNDNNYGVHANAQNGTKTNIGGAFYANEGTSAIGVYAEANSSQTGAEIWAGYFAGPIISGAPSVPSDAQFKTNINPIQDANALLLNLNPVTYNYLQTGNAAYMHFPNSLQFGLIAQEVEQVLPNLVKIVEHPQQLDSLGNVTVPSFEYKTLNYEALIPILIKGYQNQTASVDSLSQVCSSYTNTIDSLSSRVEELNGRLSDLEDCLSNILPFLCQINSSALQTTNQENKVTSEILLSGELAFLGQNEPNPFSEYTNIPFYIPEEVKSAQLDFYNDQGQRIKTLIIEERGEGKLAVFTENLSAGIYTYVMTLDESNTLQNKMIKF
jgi:hypothetical protein